MAGNAGHPFFGNQYVGSSYKGGYHYDWIPNSIDPNFSVFDSIKSNSSSTALSQGESKILPRFATIVGSGKGALIISFIPAVISIVAKSYFLYKHINKNLKLMEEASQTIELENVGTCKYCDEHLSGSEYVDGYTSDSNTAYIICRKCGEKNFAWYSD